jgi:predicted ArsR family transcriptional regulator
MKMRARKTDPATSKNAGKNAAKFALCHYKAILLALDEIGSATADEIAVFCWLDKHQICRRLPEMTNYVRVTTDTRPSKKGRPSRVWAITKAGLAFIGKMNKI